MNNAEKLKCAEPSFTSLFMKKVNCQITSKNSLMALRARGIDTQSTVGRETKKW